jgi:hypothetical protein
MRCRYEIRIFFLVFALLECDCDNIRFRFDRIQRAAVSATFAFLILPIAIPAQSETKPTVIIQERKENNILKKGLLSGAATRIAKELLLHPIDTVSKRQQVNNVNASSLLVGLYDGVGPAIIGGVPAGAVFFGVKDLCKQQLRDAGLSKELATLLAVCAANVPYWVIRQPAEVLKTKKQTNLSPISSLDEMKRYYTSKGISGLYDSYPSNILYALPADVLKFLACTRVM